MAGLRPGVLEIGARVVLDDLARTVVGMTGVLVHLADEYGAVVTIDLATLCSRGIVTSGDHLNLATSASVEMSDYVKYFTEHLPATFAYAGIDVENQNLFTGIRGKQIAGRCVLLHTNAFPYHDEWKELVATLDAALRPHDQPPGALIALDRYLHNRTGGSIGSLSHLVRAAAIAAILDGSERITRPLLKNIPVDHASESDQRGAA